MLVAVQRCPEPGEAEHVPVEVGLHPDAEELSHLQPETRFLSKLPVERIDRRLVLVDEAPGEIPSSRAGIVCTTAEQNAPVALDHSLRAGNRVRVDRSAALLAHGASVLVPERPRAERTEAPAIQDPHRGYGIPVSPRHVPATVHELTRVELLAGLPGELIAQLAGRLQREEVLPGATVVRQGEPGDRFYIVLSGLLNVTQEELGERRLLRPGDSFGEVALAMGIPRTASVRAITPAVVASCDQETFDELLRPIFADE